MDKDTLLYKQVKAQLKRVEESLSRLNVYVLQSDAKAIRDEAAFLEQVAYIVRESIALMDKERKENGSLYQISHD